MSGTIFISYRRGEDAAAAGRLYDRLEHAFGPQRLFMDVDNIPPGEDFVAVLSAQVASCDVLLALIGRGWLTAIDKTGRHRLQNPNDFVRIEIASGLAQGKRVIPVLLDGATMPNANELPDELIPLASRQAVRIVHERFKDDAEWLARVLKKALAEAAARRGAGQEEQNIKLSHAKAEARVEDPIEKSEPKAENRKVSGAKSRARSDKADRASDGSDYARLKEATPQTRNHAQRSAYPLAARLRRNRIYAGAGGGIAACLLVVLLTFGGFEAPREVASAAPGGRHVPVRIDSVSRGTTVEVMEIDGRPVASPSPSAGAAPFVFDAPVGAEVKFTVRRRGRAPLQDTIVVRENSNKYTY